MGMRRRIFLFYTLSLVLSLVLLLTVSSLVVQGVSRFYQERAVPPADDRSAQAQEILSQWPETDRDWRALDQQLDRQGYQLLVERDGRPLYSSLDQAQEEAYRRLSGRAAWPEEGTLVLQDQGLVMVGRRCGGVTLIAMPQPVMPEVLGRPRPQTEAVILSLFISGLVAIGMIVLLSLLLARTQIRRIMRPVNALTQAARRVEEGDLSTPVGYGGQDEFSAVCAAFDHMQEHLRQEREKSASYEKARTDLVAGISHDLRTPLTSVKGYIKGMRDGVANTPEKREQYLDVAYRKACDMERLLQRLFYFSRMETGNLPLMLTSTDLGEFVTQFARETQEELAESGGKVVLRGAPAAHPVRMDREQMYRVLTLTVWRQGNRECLRFADNGRGVPPEQLPHLFERFWRGDSARSSKGGEGSGLGLYIVQYIVQAHGGTVAAVIVIVGLGNGLEQYVTDSFSDLGTNTLTVTVMSRGSTRSLDADDMYELVEENSQYLDLCSTTVPMMGYVKIGSETVDSTTSQGGERGLLFYRRTGGILGPGPSVQRHGHPVQGVRHRRLPEPGLLRRERRGPDPPGGRPEPDRGGGAGPAGGHPGGGGQR